MHPGLHYFINMTNTSAFPTSSRISCVGDDHEKHFVLQFGEAAKASIHFFFFFFSGDLGVFLIAQDIASYNGHSKEKNRQ